MLKPFIFKWLKTLWPVAILAPIIWVPLPSILSGHPWKAELVLSLILAAVCGAYLFLRASDDPFWVVRRFPFIFLPAAGFAIWSGASSLWAFSASSVSHHTLVWAVYIVSFTLFLDWFKQPLLLDRTIKVLFAAVLVTAANCVIEYALRDQLDQTFGFRYGRYAEMWAALLPLFIYTAVRKPFKRSYWQFAAMLLVGAAILCAVSRASFAAAVLGSAIFLVLTIAGKDPAAVKKRSAAAAAALILVIFAIQLPGIVAPNSQRTTTLTRLATSAESDSANSLGQNIRFLFAAVGMEMFRSHPVNGIGADNFGSQFNYYRRQMAADPNNRSVLSGNEGAYPERAHNEYLQISSELGMIGIGLFAMILAASIFYGFRAYRFSGSSSERLLQNAAIAGMIAFLASSAFSSFSFRLIQNGVIFFFLLACLLRPLTRKISAENAFRPIFAAGALLVCLSLFAYSTMRGMSQFYVYQAERQPSIEGIRDKIETAKRLDPESSSADLTFGLILLQNGYYDSAGEWIANAIGEGIGTSTIYSYRISAQTLAADPAGARKTAEEALAIYPYSVFMLSRYAALLNEAGDETAAKRYFAAARAIDAKQADTWRILLTEGSERAAEAGRQGVGVPLVNDLYPADAVYAITMERYIRFPEERPKMP